MTLTYFTQKVSKYSLSEEKLKAKYKQIVAFHYVSNKTKAGIKELTKNLIEITLKEKYMGEAIPVLDFENQIFFYVF